jgi:hypothetical protein
VKTVSTPRAMAWYALSAYTPQPDATSPAQLRQPTADRPDDARGGINLATGSRLMRSQVFRQWLANRSYAMLPVLV